MHFRSDEQPASREPFNVVIYNIAGRLQVLVAFHIVLNASLEAMNLKSWLTRDTRNVL